MIARPMANRFAYQAGVELHVAQQEIVLTYALECLRQRGVLEGLLFKGGTYLRKIILGDAGRLSEDLDFTANGIPSDPEATLRSAFRGPFEEIQFRIQDPYVTEQGNWACSVAYEHEWDDGSFKLEISRREKAFLPAQDLAPVPQIYFNDLPFEPAPIPCLRLEEAVAEKLRAVQQRTSERDLYDVAYYATKPFDADLVRLLAVGKLWSVRQAFDPERVLTALDAGRRLWPELDRLVHRQRRKDWNTECRKAARRFAFLRDLSKLERDLVRDARRHARKAELLDALRRFVA